MKKRKLAPASENRLLELNRETLRTVRGGIWWGGDIPLPTIDTLPGGGQSMPIPALCDGSSIICNIPTWRP